MGFDFGVLNPLLAVAGGTPESGYSISRPHELNFARCSEENLPVSFPPKKNLKWKNM